MRRTIFVLTIFLNLIFAYVFCQIPREQVKWILPQKVYPADMAGDTLIIMTTDVPFVFVYNIPSDTMVYWYTIPKLRKYYKIEYDKETSKLAMTYLTKDTTLIFELHSFESGIVSKFSLKFEKNKFPSACYFDHKKEILYSLTNDFNFLILNLANNDTLFNFFEDMIEAEDLAYSFTLSDNRKFCGLLCGKKVYMLNLENYKIEKSYSLFSYPTHQVKISPNNKYIVRFGYDNTCDLIDTENDTIYKGKVVGKSNQIEFTNDSKYLLVREINSPFNLLKYKLPDLTIEERELIATTSDYFLKTQFEGKESLIIRPYQPAESLYHGIYLYYPDTIGPRKLLYISTSDNFYPCGQKHLIFVQHDLRLPMPVRNSNDGRLVGFLNPPIPINRLNFSTVFPYYYYSLNDTIWVADLFTNQIVKYVPLKNHNPRVIQFSNDLKYLVYRANSESDTCFKILNTETMEIVFEFKSEQNCILPQPFFLQGVYFRLADYVRFSKDSRYFGFTYRKSEDTPPIFAIVDIEKGQVIFNEFYQSPFTFTFGEYGSDEVYIQNSSMQIRKVNLKNNEIFSFPEISPISSNMCQILNRPDSDYLVQIVFKMDLTYMLVFNKTNGKIEKITQLIIDSFLVGSVLSKCYFNELYSLFYPNYPSFPIFAFWDSLTTVALVENRNMPKSEEKITIYPNPAKDILIIVFEENTQMPNGVEVIDILGRSRIKVQKQPQTNFFQIDVSSLSPGIYFVKINSRIYKFIKDF